ncbi:MAG: twin-arginine translocase TatA/TatE family subunit [Bradymonadales bacterium]
MTASFPVLAFGMPGTHEWLIILAIVLVVFGATRIPALGSAIGKGISNFRKGMREANEEADVAKKDSKALTDESTETTSSEKDESAGAS